MKPALPAALLLLLTTSVAAPVARGAITPANVGSLSVRWDVRVAGVTGALLVANGLLYVPAWDTTLYALDPDTGAERWRFKAGSLIPGGAISVPGGNICFGDFNANVYCLRGDDGSVVWQKNVQKKVDDAVWSQLGVANGRLFVGIASHADRPCTQGRLLALDLATGDELWDLKTVPERVCRTDTAIECTSDADCGGNPCVAGLGGGVTATPLPDPTGAFVYMNTVGCYTSPSIGDSDSMFKIDAATGHVIWKNRVTPPEQYGYCVNDSAVDCGTDAHCAGVGGTCREKALYHDFGFLNGPLRLEAPAPGGGTQTLIVSGSKDGTLYAFHEGTGALAWTNEVQPVPVSPGLAGYGLFNGAVAYADGRVHAALNELIPGRVCDNDHRKGCQSDDACGTGHCLPAPPHLMAFDASDGSVLWSDEIGASWSSVAVANGIVYAGTNSRDETTGASTLFAYDAAAGTRLATFALPATSVSRAAVSGDTLFVGYGVPFPPGPGSFGVRALGLCTNGVIDPGEECDPGAPDTHGCCSVTCRLVAGTCDDGNVCTSGDTCAAGHCTATVTPGAACPADDGNVCTDAVCDATGGCVQRANTSPCDDGDACTIGDRCADAHCTGSLASTEAVGCVVDRIVGQPCGDTTLPVTLSKAVGRRLAAVHRLLGRAAALAAKGQTRKVEKVRKAATTRIAGIKVLTAKAAASRNEGRRISAGCKDSIDALVERGRALVSGFAF